MTRAANSKLGFDVLARSKMGADVHFAPKQCPVRVLHTRSIDIARDWIWSHGEHNKRLLRQLKSSR